MRGGGYGVLAMGQALGGETAGGFLGDDDDDDDDDDDGDGGVGGGGTAPGRNGNGDDGDEEGIGKGDKNGSGTYVGQDTKDYFALPMSMTNSRLFKGVTKSKRSGEVEVTVKLPSK